MTETQKYSSVDMVEWFSNAVVVMGKVQEGFRRGRKLGFPTANLPGDLLDDVKETDRDGVYLGYALVPKLSSEPMKMVANLGRNITFDDVEKRVLEAHLLPENLPEFYGEEMRLCLIGFLRPEWKFASLDELIAHIKNDSEVASKILDLPKAQPFLKHPEMVDH